LAAITSGGAIPDNANYNVVLEPDGKNVGTVDEDWAVESMAGDIFLLGTNSWRIKRVEPGRVRVEDAHGAPPSVPFWNGEAPGRTFELSEAVAGVREEIAVERGVLREQAIKRQHCRGGDQFVEPDLSRGNPRPVPVGQAVLWIRLALAHTLEDHPRLVFGADLPDAAMQDRLSRGPCAASVACAGQ